MARPALATAEALEEGYDALVGHMARGDQSALAALYDATVTTVHALVVRIVKDDTVAEEVTGDVYFQAWNQAGRYDAGRGSPLSWLLAIARSRAIDRIRVGVAARTAHEPVEGLPLRCQHPGPEDAYAVDQRRRRVQAAVAVLPLDQRRAVELAYYEGLSHSEIAERLGEPDEARRFERHLVEDGCDVCCRRVEAMGEVCGDLALAPSPSAPSSAVRSRLLARVAAAPASTGLAFAFADEGQWTELKPGVYAKQLMPPSPHDRSRSYLVRMEPGTFLDRHGHECFEHCYVISGSTIVHGRRMKPGDYSYAPRGAVHEPIPSDEGALLFIVETP
jgi:RNA polymerase sigma-70 factor, ECF subfamily